MVMTVMTPITDLFERRTVFPDVMMRERYARLRPDESTLESILRVFAHLNEADRIAVFSPPIQRLRGHRNRSLVRQLDLDEEPDARLLFVHRVDEASAATQVENT